MKSQRTKTLRKRLTIARILKFLLNVGPIVVFTILAFINGAVGTKLAVGVTLAVALILTLVALYHKTVIKSRLWVLLLGIWIALDNILCPLLVIASCQIIDELILDPFVANQKTHQIASKQLDMRM